MLFIDARKLGRMVDRTHRELTDEDITRITDTYHAWRNHSPPQTTYHSPPRSSRGQALEGESQSAEPSGDSGCGGGTNRPNPEETYADIPGFCRSAPLAEIRKHSHVLTPGRYVGVEPQKDDGEPFEDKMKRLTAELQASNKPKAPELDAAIADNLKTLGFWERVE